MKPDSSQYNPDPDYLKGLIDKAGISQRQAARTIGISERVLRQYLSNREASTAMDAPYYVQFCLECLADGYKS